MNSKKNIHCVVCNQFIVRRNNIHKYCLSCATAMQKVQALHYIKRRQKERKEYWDNLSVKQKEWRMEKARQHFLAMPQAKAEAIVKKRKVIVGKRNEKKWYKGVNK